MIARPNVRFPPIADIWTGRPWFAFLNVLVGPEEVTKAAGILRPWRSAAADCAAPKFRHPTPRSWFPIAVLRSSGLYDANRHERLLLLEQGGDYLRSRVHRRKSG